LVPWLKDLHHEQMEEKSVEATIKGTTTIFFELKTVGEAPTVKFY
jgi:hypothetical protein